MSLTLSGLEHYQAHQQLHHSEPEKTSAAPRASASEVKPNREEDRVSVSDAVAILEWVAAQAPDITSTQAAEPANLGRLTDHLLRYNLISIQDAGRLMQLSDSPGKDPLLARIETVSARSDHYSDTQSWQKLNRIVNNVHAAQ